MSELKELFENLKITLKTKQITKSAEKIEKLKLKLNIEKKIQKTLKLEFFSMMHHK